MSCCFKPKESVSPKKCGAFSLIEAVIVLALVAAIIGALWSAAAKVSSTRKINKTFDAITLILSKFDEVFSAREVTGSEGLNSFMVVSGTVPRDMTDGISTIYSPWGGTMTITADSFGGYDWRILIYINGNFPRDACMEISRRLILLTNKRKTSAGGTPQIFFNPPNSWHAINAGTVSGAASSYCGSTTSFGFTSYRRL